MILVETGKGFLEFSPCYRDRAYIKMNMVGPDVSKVSETRSKNVDYPTCTFF